MTNREFWIQKGTPDLIADSFQEAEGFCIGHRSELPVIHVVEASTYAALEAQLAETKRKLEIAMESLRIANEQQKWIKDYISNHQEEIEEALAEIEAQGSSDGQ